MEFKQLQKSPEELIMESKAQAGSTLVYKDKIYYKEKKNKVDVLAPLGMFYDIEYVLNNTDLSIILFRAICGHPKLTKFKGNYKEVLYKINEERVKFNNLDYKYFYNDQVKLDLQEEQEKLTNFLSLPLNEKKQYKSVRQFDYSRDSHSYQNGGYYPRSINRYSAEEKTKIKELYNNAGSTLSDIIFDNLYCDAKSYIYDKNSMVLRNLETLFRPQSYNGNYNRYGVKVKYFRDLEDILPETKIEEVDLNTKTGDLDILVDGAYSYKFSMNIYKEKYSNEYNEHGLDFKILEKAIKIHYSKYNSIANKVMAQLGHYYDLKNSKNTEELYNNLVKSVLILDRIINSPYVELFNNVHKYITIPKTKKMETTRFTRYF